MQKLHWAMYGYLFCRLQGKEAVIPRAELEAWFAEEDHAPKSATRILADLRRLGLIRYQNDRKSRAVKVAIAPPDQGVLGLDFVNPDPDPGFTKPSNYLANFVNPGSESRKSGKSPPHTPPCKESPPETDLESDLISTRGGARAPAALATEKSDGGAGGAVGVGWDVARALRQLALGSDWLTDNEAYAFRRFVAAGGTEADLRGAVASWRERAAAGAAPRELRSFGYLLRAAERAAKARNGAPADVPPGAARKASPIRIAPRLTPEEQVAAFDRRQRAKGYAPIGEVKR